MANASLLMGLLLTVLPAATDSLSDVEILHQAETAFRAGTACRDRSPEARPHFKEAAELYETLRERGVQNACLFCAQGNAYVLAGELAPAVLAYRRALRLAPNDRTLQENLSQARAQVVYAADSSLGHPRDESLPPWLPRMRAGGWLVLYFAVYALAWLILTRGFMLQRGRLLAAGFTCFGGAALLAVIVTGVAWTERQDAEQPFAVIAQDGVLLRKGNGQAYPPRFETPLNQGVELRVLQARGDWLQVELSGGETGWLTRAQLLLDTPPETEKR